MPANELGETRRSHCLSNFGPGAIVEFRVGRNKGAAVSAIVRGLDEWPKKTQRIYERRLQSILGTDEFWLPPVDDGKLGLYLKAVRFPDWHQCPRCQRIAPTADWGAIVGGGEPQRLCPSCTTGPDNQVFVVPVRFVVTCDYGHLQDFPWKLWVPHRSGCVAKNQKLKQQPGRAGLSGLILECEDCGKSRDFENAFRGDALQKLVKCEGRMEWLDTTGVKARVPTCRRVPRTVQRGASNLYFPITLSSLAIPPFTEPLQTALNEDWARFAENDEKDWPELIRLLKLETKLGVTKEEIIAALQRSRSALTATDAKALRHEEYMRFKAGVSEPGDTDFEIRSEVVPPDLALYLSGIVRAVRLREVRAQRGFTRLNPPAAEAGSTTDMMAPLSYNPSLKWLPAIETRGEGIFISFDEERLASWETDDAVKSRVARIQDAYSRNWRDRFGAESTPPRHIEPRFVLVHVFAHALMRELTLSCGYSSASLRERLFADSSLGMAGLLIYTATTDSDGSLGGLERQGRTERVGDVIRGAIKAMAWCSNDPLCIQDTAMFSDAQNLAACHACVLAAETSCEEFNVFLDRALIVGRPGETGIGFFESLLSGDSEI